MAERFSFCAAKLGAFIIAVFLLSLVFPQIVPEFSLVSSEALSRPWILVTHIFLHSGWLHLIYNLIALLLFGSILEKFIGCRMFLIVFFVSGIAAGFAGAFFYQDIIGASGAILGVIGCFAALKPRMVVWYPLGVPMPMIFVAAVLVFLDLAGMTSPDSIAHVSHIFGLAAGIALGLWLRPSQPKEIKPEKQAGEELISDKELDEWEKRYMMSHNV